MIVHDSPLNRIHEESSRIGCPKEPMLTSIFESPFGSLITGFLVDPRAQCQYSLGAQIQMCRVVEAPVWALESRVLSQQHFPHHPGEVMRCRFSISVLVAPHPFFCVV
jgi:hypothetical protein